MTTAAPEAPDIDAAFEAALQQEAAAAPPRPDVAPPPRVAVSADPEAPHGRDEDGMALAPFGLNKKTGRPNLKAPGPGRPSKADKPRTMKDPGPAKDKAKTPAAAAAPGDYSEDLAGLGMSVWMAGAMLPPTRPYAQLWKTGLPGMVQSWNVAAQQNAAVRGWVEKLAGEGSWAWVIGVAVSTAPVLAGCLKLAGSEKDPKAQAEKDARKKELAAQCEQEFGVYILEQAGQAQQIEEQAAA